VVAAPVGAERMAPFDTGPAVVLCIHDPDRAEVSADQIAEAFGLTASQAKVALALLSGCSPKQTAEALGVSFFTVRAHLARIFEKTGTSRQAELVALMARRLGFGGLG
jgi:DNA-binding CsgD family transcriptional regulator